MQKEQSLLGRFLTRVGDHELAVLLGFAAVLCGIWIFGLIAGEVMQGNTQRLDEKLLLAFRNPADRLPLGPPFLQDAARDVTALGGVVVLSLLTIITGGFLFLDGKRHMAWFVYASIISGTILAMGLKSLFQRARPDLVPDPAYVVTTSFPSGHSMISAVVYLTLGALLARSHSRKRLKAYFLLLSGVLTLLIGISRVYLGVHWPTDVLAGWTAGASWAILCWLVARRLQREHTIEREAEPASME